MEDYSDFSPAPIPSNETRRLEAVRKTGVMDVANEELFLIYTELAKEISANSPTVVYGCKEAIKFSRDHTTEEGLNWIKMWNSSMFNMKEIEEAFKAKFEKRVGNFSKLPKKVTKIK